MCAILQALLTSINNREFHWQLAVRSARCRAGDEQEQAEVEA